MLKTNVTINNKILIRSTTTDTETGKVVSDNFYPFNNFKFSIESTKDNDGFSYLICTIKSMQGVVLISICDNNNANFNDTINGSKDASLIPDLLQQIVSQ